MTSLAHRRHRLSVGELTARLEALGAGRFAVAAVMRIASDDTSSAEELAEAVDLDPTLATRLLKLANSNFYGLSGEVSGIEFAVRLLGFRTVHTLAATTALEDASTRGLPPWFRSTSLAHAVACTLLAPVFGADPDDAHCAGMLADMGVALLSRLDQPSYAAVLAAAEDCAPLEGERAVFGIDHAKLAGTVLGGWHFPPAIVATVVGHHGEPSSPLDRTLRTARSLAYGLPGVHGHDPADADPRWLEGFAAGEVEELRLRVENTAAGLLGH